MKSVATMALESGMVLACDVYSYQNNLIAKEGDIVDKKLISKLSRYSIMCVHIKEPADFITNNFERIHSSLAFKNFENIYHNQLNAYKYMIDSFLKDGTSLNPSYLLTIHDSVKNCCKNEEQLLNFLYHLVIRENDCIYAHHLHAALLGSLMGKYIGFNSKDSKLLILCGFLYDIGKLKLPPALILKANKLTQEELKLLQTHTQLGYNLLKPQNINEKIKQCALNHHEKIDGSGYPRGLRGDAIDLFSRYINIVDNLETWTISGTDKQGVTPSHILTAFQNLPKTL